jgi:outer membrane biosynthesis protein TonB
MRPLARLGFAAVLAGATALVSGCESLENLGNLFDNKVKLQGERKPVFPEGVPGVTPGVPPEMVKGYREPVADPAPPPSPGEPPEAAEARPKPKPKPPAVQAVAKPPPAPAVQAAASAAPPPGGAPAPWPAQQQQPPQQQPQSAWPSTPNSGTVSR